MAASWSSAPHACAVHVTSPCRGARPCVVMRPDTGGGQHMARDLTADSRRPAKNASGISANGPWSKGRTDEIVAGLGGHFARFPSRRQPLVSSAHRSVCLRPYTGIMSETPTPDPAPLTRFRGQRRVRARGTPLAPLDVAGDGGRGRGARPHLAGARASRLARGRGAGRRRGRLPGRARRRQGHRQDRPAPFHPEGHERRRREAGLVQGQGHPAQLLGDVVRPLQGRNPVARRAPARSTATTS